MIGNDFLPNDFVLFGLDLTDPTDFMYDVVLGIIGLYFSFKIKSYSSTNKFYTVWQSFFFWFGISTLLSAFGHLFYNYFHVYGKFLGWIVIPISIYFIETAMINAHWNQEIIRRGKRLYFIKLILLYIVFILVWLNIPILEKPQLLFLPIAINTILGLIIGVGVFSYYFKSKISASFAYVFIGILIIFPSAFIFLFKINLHQWFSKNDFSHILMIFGLIFFYKGVVKLLKEGQEFKKVK